jgi:hypothetical protein
LSTPGRYGLADEQSGSTVQSVRPTVPYGRPVGRWAVSNGRGRAEVKGGGKEKGGGRPHTVASVPRQDPHCGYGTSRGGLDTGGRKVRAVPAVHGGITGGGSSSSLANDQKEGYRNTNRHCGKMGGGGGVQWRHRGGASGIHTGPRGMRRKGTEPALWCTRPTPQPHPQDARS